MRAQNRRNPISIWMMSLATSLAASAFGATTFTYPVFNVTAHDTNNIASVPLTGAPTGTAFNGYTVTFDWSAGANSPQSNEASFALVNQPPPQTAASVFYEDSGSAPNSKFNGNPTHLSWGGRLDANYAGGEPLNFWYVQSFGSSTANWNNVSVSLYSYTPIASGFSGNTTGSATWRRPNTTSALSNTGTAVPYQTVPFSVDSSGPYVIDTSTSGTTGYDGYLAIYDSAFDPTNQLTNLLAVNDDDPANPGGNSEVSVALQAGRSYTLVQSGFDNNDFGTWTASFSGVGAVVAPEPAVTALATAAFFIALRERPCSRRRRLEHRRASDLNFQLVPTRS